MADELPSPRRAEDFLRLDYRAPGWEWRRKKRSFFFSFLVHAVFVLGLAVPFVWHPFMDEPITGVVRVRFHEPGGEGEGGGGGGGGSQGSKPTAFIQNQPKPPQPEETPASLPLLRA